MSQEKKRLEEDRRKETHWRKWGPYLSERQWATVREDVSPSGDAWNSFSHDEAKDRAYRWGEDGIAGISDNHQRLCFALSFWNGRDPILKERLFGLTGNQGNHGEDVKECYYYLDNTPVHSYMKYLYRYPHAAYPYEQLVQENLRRSLYEMEYELLDTGVFDEEAFFDIQIEYGKEGPEEILIRISVTNQGKEKRQLHLLPVLWFRNTWSWGGLQKKPFLKGTKGVIEAEHPELGGYHLYLEGEPELYFTENETGRKGAFHPAVVHNDSSGLNRELSGTKGCAHYILELSSKETRVLRFVLSKERAGSREGFDEKLEERKKDADLFYCEVLGEGATEELTQVQREAFAGLLWNRQFYRYVVEEWSANRESIPRNREWIHIYNEDVLSVPDKWEYPCYFSWDTAFHTLPFAMIDPEFAKKQLTLLVREWYMHPNGQLPAYEWSFSDVNPPVHAWAAWRVYKMEKKQTGKGDRCFLESVFQKLLLNFTWWVNRKDNEGKNIFQGGFLGLDNISVFNRSDAIPEGGSLYQSDATSWMGMFCLNMLTIALELAVENSAYEDMASKFFEHFLYIAEAINFSKAPGFALWHEEDGFYYDLLHLQTGESIPLKVRSLVGIIPLFAVGTLSFSCLERFSGFKKRLNWFVGNRHDLCGKVACLHTLGEGERRLLAILDRDKLVSLLKVMLDEKEFLSPYGIRSLSKYHQEHPYHLQLNGNEYRIDYEPAESTLKLFGGNSNWRGPVWFPLNMLIIESLQKFHYYYGDALLVEFPTGSGVKMNLWDVSQELSKRLVKLFVKDEQGHRPLYGGNPLLQENPLWNDKILFYEYFHGDNGAGIGASHQTGWTALVAKLIHQLYQCKK